MSFSAAGPHSAPEQGQVCSRPARPRRYCRPAAPMCLDLTDRWWSETEGPDIEEGGGYSLAAAACMGLKLHFARYPDRAPFQRPDPGQPDRALTDLLTALAATLGRRQPRLRLCTKLWSKSTAFWVQWTASWRHTRRQTGCVSSRPASR